jgi:hypothetical protein
MLARNLLRSAVRAPVSPRSCPLATPSQSAHRTAQSATRSSVGHSRASPHGPGGWEGMDSLGECVLGN